MTQSENTLPASSILTRSPFVNRKVAKKRRVVWLTLPTLVVLLTLFFGGFIFGILQSFGYFSAISGNIAPVGLSFMSAL